MPSLNRRLNALPGLFGPVAGQTSMSESRPIRLDAECPTAAIARLKTFSP